MDSDNQVPKQLSFGEQAVGLTLNPSGDEKVTRLKQLLAEAIDTVIGEGNPKSPMQESLDNLAVNQLILAQMAAVKSVTWKQ